MDYGLSASGSDKISEDGGKYVDFPQYPGEDVLAHAATAYQEKAENALADRGLLAVVHDLTTDPERTSGKGVESHARRQRIQSARAACFEQAWRCFMCRAQSSTGRSV